MAHKRYFTNNNNNNKNKGIDKRLRNYCIEAMY